MLETVKKTISEYALLLPGEHVLVAVSGGPDSVALLKVLEIIGRENSNKITVAHLNHGIRGDEADREEEFVRLFAGEMDVDFISEKVNVPERQRQTGKSIEDIAREERYRFLWRTAAKCGAAKIATGHHRDDLVETFLINLFRGAGSDGLKGITPIRDNRLVRPLLQVTRDQIIAFLKAERLAWMTDSSNADQVFLRNSIRNWLLPELMRRYNPRLPAAIARTAEILRHQDDYMQGVIRNLLALWGINPDSQEMSIPMGAFNQQHRAVQTGIIKFLLETMMPSHNGINSRHIDSVVELCHKKDIAIRRLDLPAGIVVEKLPDRINIRNVPEGRKPPTPIIEPVFPGLVSGSPLAITIPGIQRQIRFEISGMTDPAEIKEHPEKAYLDYDCISGPLCVRGWMDGDRIDLMGMEGTKKLKKYFIDRKIPAYMRRSIPLLTDSLSVIWIAGERISKRVRITENTKKVLKIELV